MAKMYAWTRIQTGDVDQQRTTDHIQPGDEVSASDVGGEDELDELVACGAVRETPYPIPQDKAFEGSPREYALAQVEKMSQDQFMSAVQGTRQVGPLAERARQAMEESEFDPGDLPDEDQVSEADKAERGQETRQALEGQAGKGTGATSVKPQSAGLKGKR